MRHLHSWPILRRRVSSAGPLVREECAKSEQSDSSDNLAQKRIPSPVGEERSTRGPVEDEIHHGEKCSRHSTPDHDTTARSARCAIAHSTAERHRWPNTLQEPSAPELALAQTAIGGIGTLSSETYVTDGP